MPSSPKPSAEGADTAADRGLVERVAKGDSAALKALYDRCSGRALAIALRILRSRTDAEEVLQETFLQIWKRAREYDATRGGVEGWVVTIARTRAIDRPRSSGAAARLASSSQLDPVPQSAQVPAPLEVAEARQSRERIDAALKELPTEQRAAVEMAYYEGLSQREIAEKTGDPLGTVKTRMRLGMIKLAQLLKGYGGP